MHDHKKNRMTIFKLCVKIFLKIFKFKDGNRYFNRLNTANQYMETLANREEQCLSGRVLDLGSKGP